MTALQLFPFLLLACVPAPARPTIANRAAPVADMPVGTVLETSGDEAFRSARVAGGFVLYDVAKGTTLVTSMSEAQRRVRPMSTFKLPHTLIGLETGVISGDGFTAKWDGTTRSVPEWNQDQTLASALRYSTVWVFQGVARAIGPTRMQELVNGFDYGNRSIEGGIDTFWLTGGMRISPLEQIAFLKRMWRGELPVRADHVELLKRRIVLRTQGEATLYGKMGFGYDEDITVGWLVGAVEQGGKTALFATLAHSPDTLEEGVDEKGDDDNVMAAREGVTLELLRKYHWWPGH